MAAWFLVSAESCWKEKGKFKLQQEQILWTQVLPFSSVFILFVWLVIRCTAVEFAWSRDLHELLFLATCTSVQALSVCALWYPSTPLEKGFVCWGAVVSTNQVLGGERKAAVIKTKCWNKGKTPSGLCSSVGICVFILCADFSSQRGFVKATSSC